MDSRTKKLIYKGGFLNGKLHGRGEQWSNGRLVYNGEWKHGEKYEQGSSFYSSRGPFEKNKMATGTKLTFSAQNCHSLNLSDRDQVKLTKKLQLITKVGTDVIFLSEVWMNTVKYPENEKIVKDIVESRYELYSNSTQRSRGVAILIKKGSGIQKIKEMRDMEENMLLLDVKFRDIPCIIGAVYGPNEDNAKDFYKNLTAKLNRHRDRVIVLGGDWNTTVDTTNKDNIDKGKDKKPPNIKNAGMLAKLRKDFGLVDPWREQNPGRREYTYKPWQSNQTSSRIDFFLISDSLMAGIDSNSVRISELEEEPGDKLFDHKNIWLKLKISDKIQVTQTKGPGSGNIYQKFKKWIKKEK